jgi:hypothetical protein
MRAFVVAAVDDEPDRTELRHFTECDLLLARPRRHRTARLRAALMPLYSECVLLPVFTELECLGSNRRSIWLPTGLTNSSCSLVAVLWRTFQLIVGKSRNVAAKAGVVFERLPWKRVMIVSNPNPSTA